MAVGQSVPLRFADLVSRLVAGSFFRARQKMGNIDFVLDGQDFKGVVNDRPRDLASPFATVLARGGQDEIQKTRAVVGQVDPVGRMT